MCAHRGAGGESISAEAAAAAAEEGKEEAALWPAEIHVGYGCCARAAAAAAASLHLKSAKNPSPSVAIFGMSDMGTDAD